MPLGRIYRAILLLRGQKVMLDSDLAELYGVATKSLNQAVRRGFPRGSGVGPVPAGLAVRIAHVAG